MYMLVKRIFDIIVSIMILIILLPLFIVVGIAIKVDSKGPIVFKQLRSGKGGADFKMYKFRSMSANNDVHNTKKENEYTRVGKFIRSLSIDELPQVINILKGDMSIIGPRPWIVKYKEFFTEEQMRRLEVKPGITGLAQANGRNCLGIHDKIKYDIMYVDNISLKMDVKVIIDTIKTILNKESVDISKLGIKKELTDLKKNYKASLSI